MPLPSVFPTWAPRSTGPPRYFSRRLGLDLRPDLAHDCRCGPESAKLPKGRKGRKGAAPRALNMKCNYLILCANPPMSPVGRYSFKGRLRLNSSPSSHVRPPSQSGFKTAPKVPGQNVRCSSVPSCHCPSEPTKVAHDYVSDTLTALESARFEDHFFTCDECRMLVLRIGTTQGRQNRRI